MLTKHALLAGLMLGSATLATAQITILSEDFSGAAATPLNGLTADVGGAWSANNFINADGSFNLANEGSALLDFTAEVNQVYTLSMDILNTSTNWVGLGFRGGNITTPGGSTNADRFAFTNTADYGVAWFLYRNNGGTNAIEAFGGYGTNAGLTENTTLISATDFLVSHNMKIVIDTTGDGSSFVVSMFIDNGELVAPTSVALPISALNYAGFTYDNTGVGTIQVDNFLLTAIPEPSSYAALVGGLMFGVAALKRRRRAV